MKKTAVAIFVKTPGLSALKTRLSERIGKQKAEQFYLLSIRAIEDVTRQFRQKNKEKIDVFWAIAEKEAQELALWNAFPRVQQGEGGLGDRLHRVYSQLLKTHEQVLFLGGDSPQITEDILSKVCVELAEKADFVFGPARDGGFYLFGGRKQIPPSVWLDTSYSEPTTLQQLQQKLNSEGIQSEVQKLVDVDRVEDFANLRGEILENSARMSSYQKDILRWLDSEKL